MFQYYTFDWEGADNETDLDLGGAAGINFWRGPFQLGFQYGMFDKTYYQIDFGYIQKWL